MENNKISKESIKVQYMAGVISEETMLELSKGLDHSKEKIIMEFKTIEPLEKSVANVLKENIRAIGTELSKEEMASKITNILDEVLSGLNYKITVMPESVNLRYKYWRKLPLGILGELKSKLNIFEDDSLGDDDTNPMYSYVIRFDRQDFNSLSGTEDNKIDEGLMDTLTKRLGFKKIIINDPVYTNIFKKISEKYMLPEKTILDKLVDLFMDYGVSPDKFTHQLVGNIVWIPIEKKFTDTLKGRELTPDEKNWRIQK